MLLLLEKTLLLVLLLRPTLINILLAKYITEFIQFRLDMIQNYEYLDKYLTISLPTVEGIVQSKAK